MSIRVTFYLITLLIVFTACKLNVAKLDVTENDHTLTEQADSTKLTLIDREGEKPETRYSMPHQQTSQNATEELVNKLANWAFALDGVYEQPSQISLPGARALWLEEDVEVVNREALLIGREFAHFHPMPDGSIHLMLSLDDAKELVDKGWGEYHPMVADGRIPAHLVMVFGPRNDDEVEVIKTIILASYHFAIGY